MNSSRRCFGAILHETLLPDAWPEFRQDGGRSCSSIHLQVDLSPEPETLQ